MTAATQSSRALWNSMPGWGIFADLMPPEVLQARRAARIRRYVIVGLSSLLVVVVLLYALLFVQKQSAQNSLDKAQKTTSQLSAEKNQYADVIQMQGTVASVQAQVANLMANDIDFPLLLSQLEANLVNGMSISQLTVTLSTATATGAPQGGTGSVLDPATVLHIGSIVMTGTAVRPTDVSAYIDRLATMKGVVTPFPVSSVVGPTSVTYTIQATLTSDLYTHRYDVKPNGTK